MHISNQPQHNIYDIPKNVQGCCSEHVWMSLNVLPWCLSLPICCTNTTQPPSVCMSLQTGSQALLSIILSFVLGSPWTGWGWLLIPLVMRGSLSPRRKCLFGCYVPSHSAPINSKCSCGTWGAVCVHLRVCACACVCVCVWQAAQYQWRSWSVSLACNHISQKVKMEMCTRA